MLNGLKIILNIVIALPSAISSLISIVNIFKKKNKDASN